MDNNVESGAVARGRLRMALGGGPAAVAAARVKGCIGSDTPG